MDHLLPTEIYSHILSYMSIKDLVRLERTCRLFQSFALCEIERRLIHSGSTSDEWGILIHLGQVCAKPVRFDSRTKKTHYSVKMDPVKIKTMFDHRRPIHCSLLRKNSDSAIGRHRKEQAVAAATSPTSSTQYQSYCDKAFIINVEKGMEEGKTLELDVKNEVCQVNASLTRLPTTSPVVVAESGYNNQGQTKLDSPPIKSMAPPPLTYTLQITELSLPLSTIAA